MSEQGLLNFQFYKLYYFENQFENKGGKVLGFRSGRTESERAWFAVVSTWPKDDMFWLLQPHYNKFCSMLLPSLPYTIYPQTLKQSHLKNYT